MTLEPGSLEVGLRELILLMVWVAGYGVLRYQVSENKRKLENLGNDLRCLMKYKSYVEEAARRNLAEDVAVLNKTLDVVERSVDQLWLKYNSLKP